jgi:hypothetical protein
MTASAALLGFLGQPVNQLRELIKDLSFRNRQERIGGDLDLLERQLLIASKFELVGSHEEKQALAQGLADGDSFADALRKSDCRDDLRQISPTDLPALPAPRSPGRTRLARQ